MAVLSASTAYRALALRQAVTINAVSARLIERMDPFVGAVAHAAGLSDATLDELFGVSTPASWE